MLHRLRDLPAIRGNVVSLSALVLSVMVLSIPSAADPAAVEATISGTVKAADGSLLPSASVVLVNEQTGERVSVVTGTDGVYVASVAPGRFEVRVQLEGFTPAVGEVAATGHASITRNFVLDIATYEERLEVVGAAPRS